MTLAALALFATIAATITIDHNPVPFRCAADDAAAQATVTLIAGTPDKNGAALSALTDGELPTDSDQPSANVFFQADTWGGRVRLDLGREIDIAAILTYSWHPSTRGPQLYKVYGSDGTHPAFDAAPSSKLDPECCGWSLIAFVDTRPEEGEGGGQYAVRIDGAGRHRYLLFDFFETESDDAWGNTFYSEIDVVSSATGQ
ncbi:MAG TPA: hypothetical protein VGQ36_08275 [Thermoanaerobaculia bacterium]|jgi:hypothetical protein|nr:hypothetical protein [Thermoanaerobaculia bacterium]